MAKINKVRNKSQSHRSRVTRYEDAYLKKKSSKPSEKKDWENATCSVCMEFPHNAVLLLCSSYNKGCRPYMCATSHRFSNCLEQYKKAYTKVTSIENSPQMNMQMSDLRSNLGSENWSEKFEVPELLCPLCRGQVKGWTVVDPARKYHNCKKRACMQDKCSFVGSYKQLRKHVKTKHPLARPRAVDPVLEEKWKRLECERERNDVISTIVSSTPGAVVLGDYVLEPNQRSFFNDYASDEDDYLGGDPFFPPPPFDFGRSRSVFAHRVRGDLTSFYEGDLGIYRSSGAAGSSVASGSGRGFRRIIFGRPRRRRVGVSGGGGGGGANRDR